MPLPSLKSEFESVDVDVFDEDTWVGEGRCSTVFEFELTIDSSALYNLSFELLSGLVVVGSMAGSVRG